MSNIEVHNINVGSQDVLVTPEQLKRALPMSKRVQDVVTGSRKVIQDILDRKDHRLFVGVGPCSIHDPVAARDYGERLKQVADAMAEDLFIVMRVYFEKPRTTVGWKGLINDPDLDGSFHINRGLRLARKVLLDVNELGLPAASEFLDTTFGQYYADLVSFGAIGARTVESQIHRELASGLSCAVGFKNGTDGTFEIAIDAIRSASQPHHFLSVTKDGFSAIFATSGNEDCHVILRGGAHPNYDMFSVDDACALLEKAGLPPRVMIDASHANSRKQPARQIDVTNDIATQIARGDKRIIGVMLESNLVEGRQDVVAGQPLTYGQSITDACMSWDSTDTCLRHLAKAVAKRRAAKVMKSSA